MSDDVRFVLALGALVLIAAVLPHVVVAVWRLLPWWLRNPGRALSMRFNRRVINHMAEGDLNVIFDGIVDRNDFRKPSTLDSHYQRLANEVVPDTAIDGEDPK